MYSEWTVCYGMVGMVWYGLQCNAAMPAYRYVVVCYRFTKCRAFYYVCKILSCFRLRSAHHLWFSLFFHLFPFFSKQANRLLTFPHFQTQNKLLLVSSPQHLNMNQNISISPSKNNFLNVLILKILGTCSWRVHVLYCTWCREKWFLKIKDFFIRGSMLWCVEF